MTLFETILYIGLMGILMSILLLSAFTFLGESQMLQGQAFKAEEIILFHYNEYKS